MLNIILDIIERCYKTIVARINLHKDTISRSSDAIYRTLHRTFPNANIYLADSRYQIPQWNRFWDWIRADNLNLVKYKPEIFDCDNYAFESFCRVHRIIGNISYGFAFSSEPPHAFNILISVRDGIAVNQIEPQNDSIANYPNDRIYLIVM